MDLHDELIQLAATVRDAKAMPMSAFCLVNRSEMLDVLERLRDELPVNLEHADSLLSHRDAVIAAGREQAERLLEGARAERERLIEETGVLLEARARAAAVTLDARAGSTRLLADADEYVDRRLADFEVLLGQLGSQVNNGRLRLATRRSAEQGRVQESAPDGDHHTDTRADAGLEPHRTAEPVAVAMAQQGAGSAERAAQPRDPAFG